MSEKETIRAAVQILSQQLVQVTFHSALPPMIDPNAEAAKLNQFITNFEAILDSIMSLTHGALSSSVKKTMLASQLRGVAARWAWISGGEFEEMDYEQFKSALRQQFGYGKEIARG
jgi:hypothetical protein